MNFVRRLFKIHSIEKIERRQGADSPQAVEKKAEQERWLEKLSVDKEKHKY